MRVNVDHPTRSGLVGPVLIWELVRQSRKGRGYFARVAYTAAVLTLLFVMMGDAEVTQKNAANLSERAVVSYLVLQYLAVVLLTPLFVSGAFIEDRQQNTLQLLLTTPLTPREILLGKLGGHLLQVLGVLLAGVPVLALLQLLGGVNPKTLLIHTTAALGLIVICGLYAIRASTLCSTVGGATIMSYSMILGGTLLAVTISTPLAVYVAYRWPADAVNVILGTLLLLNTAFAFLSLRNAILSIATREQDRDYGVLHFMSDEMTYEGKRQVIVIGFDESESPRVPSDQRAEGLKKAEASPDRLHRAVRWNRIPPVTDRPILWKETYFPLSEYDVLLAGFLCGLPLIVFLISFVRHETYLASGPFVIWTGEVLLSLFLILTTLRAAGTFARERIQQSLPSLLGTPLGRREIVFQFWMGCFKRFRFFALGTGLVCMAAVLHSPLFLVFVLPVFLGEIALFSMLGIALSLGRMSPFQTRVLLGTYFFVGAFVLPVFLPRLVQGLPLTVLSLVSPFLTLRLGTEWRIPHLGELAITVTLLATVTAGLFFLACRRLGPLQKRS